MSREITFSDKDYDHLVQALEYAHTSLDVEMGALDCTKEVDELRELIDHIKGVGLKEIEIKWTLDDVLFCNVPCNDEDGEPIEIVERCTPEQASEVLRRLKDNHDAIIGINWDVVEHHLEEVLNEQGAA